jgi:acyl-CoA reductase-like NAD-dependent aldehyde dehydrogenase
MATVDQPATTGTPNGSPAHGSTIPVDNPATGKTIGHVADTSAEGVAEIVARARAAQPAWAAKSFHDQAALMYAMRTWLVANRQRMVDTICGETGKAREDALTSEVMLVADSLGFWAKRAEKFLADERVRAHSPLLFGKKTFVRYKPLGVVGVIGPWNYPLSNSFGDCIPALMAGNTVVLKPSEVTPLTSLLVAEGTKAAGFPADVFQVATGRGGTGAALVDEVDGVMFTGSTATGKKVMARAADTLTPVSLELGGKDPMVVLRDADIERAANAAVYYAMSNSGQICMAVERVYVEEPVHDEFVAKVVEKTRALRQGPPAGPGEVEVGAMTWPPQTDLVESHVRDAVDKGASVLVGGSRRSGQGDFFEPTVLTDVDHSMTIMRDETFGPTLPIMKVGDAEEAIRLANDTPYGLNSSVWTKDVEKGERLAARLDAGNACVNDCVVNYAAQELPFGGTGDSGIGVRHSAKGIQKYCTTQSILVTRMGQKREPHMFPYTPFGSKALERLVVLMYGRTPRKYRKS